MDDVDKYPTIGVLVLVELSTIERELYENVVILNLPSLDSFQIIATTGGVTVLLDLPTMRSGILQNVSCCFCTIVHFVCGLGRAIESLNYRTQRNSDELSPRFSRARSITLLSTYRAMIAVDEGASVTNAGIRAHIIRDWNHPAELFDMSLHLPERQERIIRITLVQSGANGIIGCPRGICCREENTKSFDKVPVINVKARIWLSIAKTINIFLSHVTLFQASTSQSVDETCCLLHIVDWRIQP